MHKRIDRPSGRDAKQDPRPKAEKADAERAGVVDELRRVVVEGVSPEIDCGRYPVKRVVGDEVVVEADAFADGHDVLQCSLLYRKGTEREWQATRMLPLGNDRWKGSFPVTESGRCAYTVEAAIDPFATWRRDLSRWIEARQDIGVDLRIGAKLVEAAAARAAKRRTSGARADAAALRDWAKRLEDAAADRPPPVPASKGGATAETRATAGGAAADRAATADDGADLALDLDIETELVPLMDAYGDHGAATRYPRELPVVVDRERARFSAWYEFFPRSVPPSGSFRDCEAFIPYIRDMGFDVVYLPPIHPIGVIERKGPNNDPIGVPGDAGSPWAIGGADGGHEAIHPALGDFDDFRRLRERVESEGMELALDIAFQASPDHPWVREHPEWFRKRPDGTIQYAENPPKKYQDIYPFDFDSEAWPALWEALEGVIRFWIDQAVKIFRVDNPHTKPFPFWERAIGRIKGDHPDVLFLSEAFTRPRIMYRLAKLGFSQSYTYFTWRNAKWELEAYLRELNETEVREYFRPNFWPNTPDILHEYLQTGGRPAFMIRFILAATLSGNYGIYGPAFELLEGRPVRPGSEEYLDSEKYQVRAWDLERPDSLRPLITRLNEIRRANPALQHTANLRLHAVDNERIMAYSKRSPDGGNVVLVVITLDPQHTQSGWVDFPADLFDHAGAAPDLDSQRKGKEADDILVHDLLGGGRYRWKSGKNFVKLDPHTVPAHIFRPVTPAEALREEKSGRAAAGDETSGGGRRGNAR